MKTLILIFIFLTHTYIVLADNEPIIKIIKNDGETIFYKIYEIQSINFEEYSYSGLCKIFLKQDSIINILTSKIAGITVKKGIDFIDSLSINYKATLWDSKIINIPINVIQEITFLNTNTFNSRIYTNLAVTITGIESEYNYYYEHSPGGSSSYDQQEEFRVGVIIRNSPNYNHYMNYISCYTETKPIANANLNFSSGDYSEVGLYFSCTYFRANIFLDSNLKIIDSLFVVRNWRQYEEVSRGSYRDESDFSDELVLYSIPFSYDIDGSILVNYNFKELSRIKYSYNKKNINGTSGIHTVSYIYFKQFLNTTDSSLVKITIN